MNSKFQRHVFRVSSEPPRKQLSYLLQTEKLNNQSSILQTDKLNKQSCMFLYASDIVQQDFIPNARLFQWLPKSNTVKPLLSQKVQGSPQYGGEYKLVMESHVSASFKTRNLYVCPKKYICRFMIQMYMSIIYLHISLFILASNYIQPKCLPSGGQNRPYCHKCHKECIVLLL